jgi:3-dehydroquinate synthetase
MSFQAIETGFGYGQWLHGEAVAVGMVLLFSSFLNRHSSSVCVTVILKEVVWQFSGHGC